MTLKASLEILVHFEQMRNIDLFQQGNYMLKSYIYQENISVKLKKIFQNIKNKIFFQGKRVYAQPYHIVDIHKSKKKFDTSSLESSI